VIEQGSFISSSVYGQCGSGPPSHGGGISDECTSDDHQDEIDRGHGSLILPVSRSMKAIHTIKSKLKASPVKRYQKEPLTNLNSRVQARAFDQ